MDHDTQAYILLLLADGNLPTGSFVASSGFESYVKHGFFSSTDKKKPCSTSTTSSTASRGDTERTMDFISYSLQSYSRSALPFVKDAHIVMSEISRKGNRNPSSERCRIEIRALDALYDNMTLNHVARRASKAQGVALMTLFSKGFSRPNWLRSDEGDGPTSAFIDQLKLDIRHNVTHGHLPICWGILTAALGLTIERSQHLCLFLHARGLLSAAIRMNSIGPYAAQQLLLHAIRPLVESQMAESSRISTGLLASSTCDTNQESASGVAGDGPANTWPLGEILLARHDLQHSRIFNS